MGKNKGSMTMTKRKKKDWFKFQPQAWRGDDALQLCSLEAQGLWINMICIMHNEDDYGHLVLNGRPVSDAQLARLTGTDESTIQRLKSELETADVFSTSNKGVIYSRRMVRDEKISKKMAKNGKIGASVTNSNKKKNHTLPRQNLGKGRDLRVQSTEFREEKNTKKENYWFDGKIIKLVRKDYEEMFAVWSEGETSPQNDTAFMDYLNNRDRWLAEQAVNIRRNWFMSTWQHVRKQSGSLNQ